ncbi:MAG: urea ABC transporter permease subunit UrtB [Gemmataceae bacterium]
MSLDDIGAAFSNSLSLSSLYILTALGLAITFGVMRVINMAHGEMLMLGAYSAHVVSFLAPKWLHALALSQEAPWLADMAEHLREYGLYYAIPISFLVVGLVGYLLEIGLIRFLYGRPLDTLLATWGVSLIIQQAVLITFGANLQETHLPHALQGGVAIGEVTLPIYRLFIVGITGLCLLAVYLWFYKTSFGLQIRAVVQNRPMASALGVSTRRIDSLTFAFATGLAGVAGCILANVYNVKYTMGSDYIVEAFMVVILGGLGRLGGSVAAGALIGFGICFVEKALPKGGDSVILSAPATVAKMIVLAAVLVFLLIRPSGLFVTKERTYD